MLALPIVNTIITEAIPTANFTSLLNPEECQKVIDLKQHGEKAKVNRVSDGTEDTELRDTMIYPIPHDENSQWIYELLVDRVSRANYTEYEFNVAGIFTDLQLLEYKEGGHYGWHMDMGPGEAAYRKLTALVQLSDPEDFEGGELWVNAGTEREIPKEQGMIAVFPTWILHKVTPVTKGTRYTLAAWFQGHERFK